MPNPKFNPMTNPLPSKVKEVIDNPTFKSAIENNDFQTAKSIALNTIMQSSIRLEDKETISNVISSIEASGASVIELQKYLYNSWLKYIGLGVIKSEIIKKLIALADSLDTKGLTKEAEEVDKIIKEANIDNLDNQQLDQINKIMEIVSRWESTDKDLFIREVLLPALTMEKLQEIISQQVVSENIEVVK